MKYEFGFGNGRQVIDIPEENIINVLRPNIQSSGLSDQEIYEQMKHPVGTPRLKDIVHAGKQIAVVTSDISRPMPTYRVMPLILDELYIAGVKAADITLVYALGSHRKHSEEEKRRLAGERVYREIKCIDSIDTDHILIGYTRRGTPVDICRAVADADIRICLGNIEYHYFAGYSGGGKAIMPGVSTRQAIQMNHRWMMDEAACAGRLLGNPVREDIEEAATMVGVDFIFNVVLNENKEIVYAIAGDMMRAHRQGCEFLDRIYRVPIDNLADIVIVSQGGTPKDLNLYQAQKGLDNARFAVKPGGIIILIGSCKEGFGDDIFQSWMTSGKTSMQMIDYLERDFQLGGHKAAVTTLALEKATVYLVSEMTPGLVSRTPFIPFSDGQSAFSTAMHQMGKAATVTVMQYGSATLPKLIDYI